MSSKQSKRYRVHTVKVAKVSYLPQLQHIILGKTLLRQDYPWALLSDFFLELCFHQQLNWSRHTSTEDGFVNHLITVLSCHKEPQCLIMVNATIWNSGLQIMPCNSSPNQSHFLWVICHCNSISLNFIHLISFILPI